MVCYTCRKKVSKYYLTYYEENTYCFPCILNMGRADSFPCQDGKTGYHVTSDRLVTTEEECIGGFLYHDFFPDISISEFESTYLTSISIEDHRDILIQIVERSESIKITDYSINIFLGDFYGNEEGYVSGCLKIKEFMDISK